MSFKNKLVAWAVLTPTVALSLQGGFNLFSDKWDRMVQPNRISMSQAYAHAAAEFSKSGLKGAYPILEPHGGYEEPCLNSSLSATTHVAEADAFVDRMPVNMEKFGSCLKEFAKPPAPVEQYIAEDRKLINAKPCLAFDRAVAAVGMFAGVNIRWPSTRKYGSSGQANPQCKPN